MSFGEFSTFSVFCQILEMKMGSFRGRELSALHWEGNAVEVEAFLSGAVCAASPALPSACLWATILVCIGSNHVRGRRLLGVSGAAQVPVERTLVGLWGVGSPACVSGVASGEEWLFQSSGFPFWGRTVM